jgi:glycosyltransferase involved in cell wall biosynthesis
VAQRGEVVIVACQELIGVKPLATLCIVSHVIHYRYRGRLCAYGPYAREIDIWADLFARVIIAAPCREEFPAQDAAAFSRSNITIIPQKETGGDTVTARVAQVLALPKLILGLAKVMNHANAIHVRCPGNLGLLGALLGPLFSRYLVAKYAGQWNGYPGEPWTARLQRWILRSAWWRGPVIVYGSWPNQPPNVVPFYTSVLTVDQIARARAAVDRKRRGDPLTVLYVGRLSAAKNVDVLISAIGLLESRQTHCVVVGDGPQRQSLESLAARLGIQGQVTFTGAIEFEHVLDQYERADVIVLASQTEGWPKALAEGMAFGLVCIGSNRGLIPHMLEDGRGITVPPGDAKSLADALQRVIDAPDNFQLMRERAAGWAQAYSLEGLRHAVRALLMAHWKVALRDPATDN